MIKLDVEAMVFPSEDEQKVKKAICFLYPFEEITKTSTEEPETYKIIGTANGLIALDKLFSTVRKQRNVQVFHNYLNEAMNIKRNRVRFMLNKQFLTVGRINLCETEDESPLGPVYVTISGDNIEKIVNYLFPPTEDGAVLEATDIPTE
jgi:predicted RNA binding protein with dsRBD fold (UPF0201 family)